MGQCAQGAIDEITSYPGDLARKTCQSVCDSGLKTGSVKKADLPWFVEHWHGYQNTN